MTRILLTGACGPTPRSLARSLRDGAVFGDATLVGSDRGGNWYGFHEGLYDRVIRVPGVSDPGYAQAMAQLCARERIDAAIVSPEAEVAYWSGREFPVPTILPGPGVVDVAVSKQRLYDALADTDLIPSYSIVSRDDLLDRRGLDLSAGPVWLRDFSDGSSSGLGAVLVSEIEQAYAWAVLNAGIERFMVAAFLPGRNLAVGTLFVDGELVRVGCYERLEYFAGHLVISGVTGNICRGRLIDDADAIAVGARAVRLVAERAGETPHGLFTVDLRGDADETPKVTEINVRHTAGTGSVAAGGANLAEAQVLAALGRTAEIGPALTPLPAARQILRDIDGVPLLVERAEVALGETVGR